MLEPKCESRDMVTQESSSLTKVAERVKTLTQFPPLYGAMNEHATDTCPTCCGTGRIPRGHEDQLVAVIPCNDKRLKPNRTKLYVCVSVGTCLLFCCLILFFLYPRSVTLTPVSVLSVMVYFTDNSVDMEVTNLINITNDNYLPIQIAELDIQSLFTNMVAGNTKITNMSSIQSRSQRLYKVQTDLTIVDKGLNAHCKSSSVQVHNLLLVLQMTLNLSYLSHTERLSFDIYEYIDCGTNTTVPHPVR